MNQYNVKRIFFEVDENGSSSPFPDYEMEDGQIKRNYFIWGTRMWMTDEELKKANNYIKAQNDTKKSWWSW